MLTETRKREMTGHNGYANSSNNEKAEYLLNVSNDEFEMGRGFKYLYGVTTDEDAKNLYNKLIDAVKKCGKNIKTDIYTFIAFCKSLGIDDIFILRDLLKTGLESKAKISRISLIGMIIDFTPKDKEKENKPKENEIPKVEGEIISQATANRILNQNNLVNPPVVVDAVAKEIDLNGQVRYADADNNTKLNYYKDTINSNILLQENFYLPESHLKNLVDMLTSPVFKQTMAEHHMVSNKFGPDFTELRHYENFDRTRYNLVLTARTTDKRRNIIITVNTANTDYIGVFTDARSVCNKSK